MQILFNKNFLFDGNNIKQEKGRIKEKKRAKGKSLESLFLKKQDSGGMTKTLTDWQGDKERQAFKI
jgi:hypothetical protein